jgi:hypothetical protein
VPVPDPGRLFSTGSLDAAFGDGSHTTPPWRRAARSKRERLFDADTVRRVLDGPIRLEELDPTELACTQPWVLRHHVTYYLGDMWERTGRTSADMHDISNRFPLVWIAERGMPVILAGHHRSMAALLHGRPLLARVARPADVPPPPSRRDVAVTPRLRITTTDAGTVATTGASLADPAAVANRIIAGSTVAVPDHRSAERVLELLGLTTDERRDRLIVAGVTPTQPDRKRSTGA